MQDYIMIKEHPALNDPALLSLSLSHHMHPQPLTATIEVHSSGLNYYHGDWD